ncbi:MAG: pyruvate dehydrogenase (acetyl-transferring), homodimeric type [Gemmataceae bacterium]
MLVTPEALANSQGVPEDQDPQETAEFVESIEAVIKHFGADRAKFILESMLAAASKAGPKMPTAITTAYINTIPLENQPAFPGDRRLERNIKSAVRWNAMAMVLRANKSTNVGGHISTFASAATLYEIGFNHFFRGRDANHPGDVIFFQGHASPGMYSRAFLEGRLNEKQLHNFRQELQPGGGLSSYPHPWLMPEFWQYPTVSMGLGPIMSIYHARYNRYLRDRGLSLAANDARVWAFLGDGECDEPESLGAIGLAGREKLDNLTWVINCNLQRLDGPVRGNGKIIQELEGIFHGAGWNVIKVVWGSDWDSLLKNDASGALAQRMMEVVDGEYQEYVVKGGGFIRENFFNTPELRKLVEHLSDEQIANLKRGGHDPVKVYAAYKSATEHKGQPTVILVKTVKGYGIPGDGGEGKNTTHQLKKLVGRIDADPTLSEEERGKRQMLAALKVFRDRFNLKFSDDQLSEIPFLTLDPNSEESQYLHARRKALGGYQPLRNNNFTPCTAPLRKSFEGLYQAFAKPRSTTLSWVDLMTQVMRDPNIGKLCVPIVPDEGQTFGMPPMYKAFGIYSSVGQAYTPVDKGTLTEYRESTTGQILQEGINEAGSMSSWIAAGTAYSTHGVNTIPFYIYYSMFGFQRIGDLAWAAADARCRGFLLGATAGRTTINGEGLQHEDGHSHLVAMTIPTCKAYDPAYAYELSVIIEDGINRMFVQGEECFYYLTVYNEAYPMPGMPSEDVREGIIRGIYPLKAVDVPGSKLEVKLLGSGVILLDVLRAQSILAEKFGISSTVYSVTSYQELRKDALACERHNRLNPLAKPLTPYVTEVLQGSPLVPVIASSDYMRALPETVAPYLNGRMLALGTDGFGRSETRKALRRFFEVDAESVAIAALSALADRGEIDRKVVAQAIPELGIDPSKPAPWTV